MPNEKRNDRLLSYLYFYISLTVRKKECQIERNIERVKMSSYESGYIIYVSSITCPFIFLGKLHVWQRYRTLSGPVPSASGR